jgi:hypothetical protein
LDIAGNFDENLLSIQEAVKRYGSVVQSSRIRMQEAPLVRLMKMVEEEKKGWAALYAGHKHPKVWKVLY